LPPLFTGYVQEIIGQLISGALAVARPPLGNRAVGIKQNSRIMVWQTARFFTTVLAAVDDGAAN
jgi:hypothetical protein